METIFTYQPHKLVQLFQQFNDTKLECCEILLRPTENDYFGDLVIPYPPHMMREYPNLIKDIINSIEMFDMETTLDFYATFLM